MKSDAGSEAEASEPTTAREWYDLNRRRYIEQLRRQAKRAYGQSVVLTNVDDEAAEQAAIRSLNLVTRAFWNAEDSELEAPLHDEMHRYGRYKRQTFRLRFGLRGWSVLSALSNSDRSQAFWNVRRLQYDIPSVFDMRGRVGGLRAPAR